MTLHHERPCYSGFEKFLLTRFLVGGRLVLAGFGCHTLPFCQFRVPRLPPPLRRRVTGLPLPLPPRMPVRLRLRLRRPDLTTGRLAWRSGLPRNTCCRLRLRNIALEWFVWLGCCLLEGS